MNPFLCNQGIGNVAKETEDKVKRHGVKGVKASKDDGVEESFVSAESMSLLFNQSSITDFFNPFLCNQGIGNVAKETEDNVKRHGVNGVKASKNDGVEESFVSFQQICHYYSINHLLLTF